MATAAVALSCAESNIDNGITAEKEGTPFRINLTLDNGDPSTRIAITEDAETKDWITSWTDTDLISVWDSGEMYMSGYGIADISDDGQSASFDIFTYTGTVRMAYPGSMMGYGVTNNVWNISLATQNVSMGTYDALSSNTYMITEDLLTLDVFDANDLTYGVPAPAMKHIGTAIELGLRFTNIPENVNASITKIEVGGVDGISIPVAAGVDVSKAYSDADFYSATAEGAITLKLGNNIITNYDGTEDTEYTIPFNALPFEVAAGEKLAFTLYAAYTYADGTSETVSTTIYADNTGSESVAFEVGKYTTINKSINMSTAIAPPAAFTIGDITATALMITIPVDMDESVCDGYGYYYMQSNWGAAEDSLENYISYGMATIVTEDSDIVLGSSSYLYANTAYSIAIAPVKSNGDGSYTMSGDIEALSISTATGAVGQTDADIDFELNSEAVSVTGLGITAYNNENISGLYYKCVKVSEVDDIDAYINEYLNDPYAACQTFTTSSPMGGGTTIEESLSLAFSSLSDGTEYYIFAVAIANDGSIGNSKYITASTPALVVDSSIKPEITYTTTSTSVKVNITFGDCAKVLISNENSYGYTAETIKPYFINDMGSSWPSYTIAASEATDGVYVKEYSGLAIGATYTLLYMGVNADGAIGDVQSISYTTDALTFDSSATLNVTIDESSALIPDTYGDYVILTLNVEMTDGAVEYKYGSVDASFVNNSTKPQVWAQYLLGNWPNTSTDAQITCYLYNSGYQVVLVPVDAEGKYGMPILVDSSSLWESSASGDGSDTGDDTGMTPRM